MNYNDIKDMTDAEAVAYFGPLTVSQIPCGDLENLLGWASKANRNPVSGAWEGLLVDVMNADGSVFLVGLGELFSHLNKPRSLTIDTHLQPWGSKMEDLLNGLLAYGHIDASLVSNIHDLAGGLEDAGLDEAAVAVIRAEGIAAEEARVADEAYRVLQNDTKAKYDELYNQHVAPLYSAKDMTDASWIAALQAMSSNWSV